MITKKKLDFSFSVLYLCFLDFDEDFISPKENEMTDGRENQN